MEKEFNYTTTDYTIEELKELKNQFEQQHICDGCYVGIIPIILEERIKYLNPKETPAIERKEAVATNLLLDIYLDEYNFTPLYIAVFHIDNYLGEYGLNRVTDLKRYIKDKALNITLSL
jgi:hypothetical protein